MAVQCWSELDLRVVVPGLALKTPQKKNIQKIKTRKKPSPFFFLGGGGGVVISFALNMYFAPIMLTKIRSAKCYTDRISHNNNVIIYSTFIKKNKNIHK